MRSTARLVATISLVLIAALAAFTAVSAQQGGSLHRCNYREGTEKATGGNGATGHDETSENESGAGATWKRNG